MHPTLLAGNLRRVALRIAAGISWVAAVSGCAPALAQPADGAATARPPMVAEEYRGSAPAPLSRAAMEAWVENLASRAPNRERIGPFWEDLFSSESLGQGPPRGLLASGTLPDSDPVLALVAQGPSAIPVLLEHLEDTRKGGFERNSLGLMTWTDWRDALDSNQCAEAPYPTFMEGGQYPCAARHPGSLHAITVGDVCFAILGQILNRDFSPVSYAPTSGQIYCSPTCCGGVARVVRERWRNRDIAAYQAYALRDATSPDNSRRAVGALVRLAYFFPELVPGALARLFSKRLIDRQKVTDFIEKSLMAEQDSTGWPALLDEFVRDFGDAYREAVLGRLRSEALIKHYSMRFKGDPRSAERLDRLCPGWRTDNRAEVLPWDTTDFWTMIKGLVRVPSRSADALVEQSLRTVERLAETEHERTYIALACLEYLRSRAPGSHEAELRLWEERKGRLPSVAGIRISGPLEPDDASLGAGPGRRGQ